MKRKISLLFVLIFMLVLSTLLTSCLTDFDVPTIETPSFTPSTKEPEDDLPDDPVEDPADDPEDVPEDTPEQMVQIKYVFSNFGEYIQTVSSKTCFTTEKIAERDSIISERYGFKFEFYSDAAYTTPYDFTASKIQGQHVYCKPDGKAGENITWEFDTQTGVITFAGTGDMYPFVFQEYVPWHSRRGNIIAAEIPEGITSIADNAFSECELMEEKVVFPESLKKIGKNAFSKTSLKEVSFPDGLIEIGDNAFKECVAIENIVFNESLNNIGAGAFDKCTGLRSIVLNEYVLDIGSSAFNGCKTLSSVYYMGTESQFKSMGQGFRNFEIGRLSQTWYFSADKPSAPGPYWHYDSLGNVVQWAYAIWYIDTNNPNVAINLKDRSDPQGTPELLVDFVDIEVGITQANIDFKNNIVYHGYKFVDFNPIDGTEFDFDVGTKLESDIRLAGDRGNLCGDNLKFSRPSGVLTISKIDPTNPDAEMWDFENYFDAPWHGKTINKIVISGDISYIGKNAFCEINGLTYVEIPTSVTEVNPEAFSGNNELLYVFYMGTPLELYGDKDNGVDPKVAGLSQVTLVNTSNVVSGKVYANATGLDPATLDKGNYWIENGASPKTRITWAFESGHLTLGGLRFENNNNKTSGVLPDYASKSDRPWNHYEINSVAILDNIYRVGALTLADFSTIEVIEMSNKVDYSYSISDTAFVGTKFFTDQYESDGTVVISFANNNRHLIAVNPDKIVGALYKVEDGTISIAENAFNGCSNIQELIIPKNIEKDIAPSAFDGLTNLTTVYFNGSASDWEKYVDATQALDSITNATVYFYSNSNPGSVDSNHYWHYDNNLNPIKWF